MYNINMAIADNTKSSIRQMWTDAGQEKYDFYFNGTRGVFGIRFVWALRAFDPPNFDYMNKFQEEVDKLDSSGDSSAMFSILGGLEDTWPEGDVVKARFLMPGSLNQTLTFDLDPQSQDFNGKMGLKIRCLIKRIEISTVDTQTQQS